MKKIIIILIALFFTAVNGFTAAGNKMNSKKSVSTESISQESVSTEPISQESISQKTASTNVIFSDYPDPDIICVDDTYYMVSTTMYFMPGGVILRSYNLVDWEIASYVYDELDGTPAQRLWDDRGIYSQGMWAASIRHHNGLFYVSFVANDTHQTYLYTSEKIEGPWKKI